MAAKTVSVEQELLRQGEGKWGMEQGLLWEDEFRSSVFPGMGPPPHP